MSTETLSYTDEYSDEYEPYRTLSRSAILSLVFGLISMLALVFPAMLVVPLVGAVLVLSALVSIRRYPNELTGIKLAISGLVLCSLLFVGGIARHSYIYATEVPDGYQRISFYELQPEKGQTRMPVPLRAIELNGKQIFIKGYVHPGVKGKGPVKVFVLVPDMGTCCFGGQPKLTDMILVTMKDPLRIRYAQRKRKLGGILKVDKRLKPVSGLNGVYYQLETDYLE